MPHQTIQGAGTVSMIIVPPLRRLKKEDLLRPRSSGPAWAIQQDVALFPLHLETFILSEFIVSVSLRKSNGAHLLSFMAPTLTL